MADLFSFTSSRSIRRVIATPLETLPLYRKDLPPDSFAATLAAVVENFPDPTERAIEAARLATERNEINLDQLDQMTAPPIRRSPQSNSLWFLVQLDRWLVQHDNRPSPAAFDMMLDQLTREFNKTKKAPKREEQIQVLETLRMLAELMFADELLAALLQPSKGEMVQRLTRLLLVIGLVEIRITIDEPFENRDAIGRLLRNRSIALPSNLFPAVLPPRRAQLVRQTTVADLWVVRHEWRCYLPGEIADIRNVMSGETLDAKLVRLEEREVTTVDTGEQLTSTERTDESRMQTELSEEAQRQLSLSIKAQGQVDVAAESGSTKINASASASADFSMQDATRRATKVARDVLARSVSRIEARIKSERTDRALTRIEDSSSHGFTNPPSQPHKRGIYRWVDRVDWLQIFRYPDRFQLEFQIPEPGRFLLSLLQTPTTKGSARNPGEFKLQLATISRENYADSVFTYFAQNVPAPPEPRVEVSTVIVPDELKNEGISDGSKVFWNPPVSAKSAEIPIPSGYAARTVTVSLHAAPLRAWWRRENEGNDERLNLQNFHQIVVDVAVGEFRWSPRQGGANTVQGTRTQFRNAELDWNAQGTFDAPLVVKVPATINAVGANTATLAVKLMCQPTDQAINDWRQTVYDACFTAWDAARREYEAEQARLQTRRALFERSGLRHAEMIQNEIKRHVVAWLLDESPFVGRPGVIKSIETPDVKSGIDTDVNVALASANDIQFLEQAIEWSNLSYVTYPYYWGDRGRWADIAGLETVDPFLGSFLRAGSIRVVVPARPGFSEAVQHWLLFHQPWAGGAPPIPGDPLYVSVAQEIRDLTQPPEDGEPGDTWEVRQATPLVWLDPSEDLPKNTAPLLGKPPHEPTTELCPP